MSKPNLNPNPAMNSEDRNEVTARIVRVKRDEFEVEYRKEKAALDAKYQKIYQPLYSQRFDIVTGAVKVDGNDGTKNMAVLRDDEDKGVQSFWLIALKNNKRIAEAICRKDEDALAFLTDIKWSRVEPEGFKIDFFFESTNPFFSNPVLTKTYCMIGGILKRTLGSVIEWFPGKSLTENTRKKGAKRAADLSTKNKKPTAESDEECFSFFNFFTPLEVIRAINPVAEERRQLMLRDYRIGITIRDKIIPHAFYWFTREALIEEHQINECPDSDDQEFKDMGEDGDDDDDGDSDDDDDDDYDDEDDNDDDEYEYYNVANYPEKDDMDDNDDGASKRRKTH